MKVHCLSKRLIIYSWLVTEFYKFFIRWVSCIYACTNSFLLHQTLSLALSQRSNQVHIFHSVVPFSFLTLFSGVSVLHISLMHWRMFVFAGFVVPDSFWCAEGFAPGLALVSWPWEGYFCHASDCWSWLLMFSVPILFWIFANGTIWSPSALLWLHYCWIGGGWLTWILGFNLYYRQLGDLLQ